VLGNLGRCFEEVVVVLGATTGARGKLHVYDVMPIMQNAGALNELSLNAFSFRKL